ncbi:MAG TPA: response regulator [Sphingobacteriaceae bacterium]
MAKRVLIIDDDKDILEVLDLIFSDVMYQVFYSTDAKQLYSLMEEVKPDLLILDYFLNGVTAAEICRKIKDDPETKELPIIIVSAYPANKLDLERSSYDLFIPKPFDIEAITKQATELVAFKGFRTVNF